MPSANPNLMSFSQNNLNGMPNSNWSTAGWTFYRSNSDITNWNFADGYNGFVIKAGRSTGEYACQRYQRIDPVGGKYPIYDEGMLIPYEVGQTYCISVEVKATDTIQTYLTCNARDSSETVHRPDGIPYPAVYNTLNGVSEEIFYGSGGYTTIQQTFTANQDFVDAYNNYSRIITANLSMKTNDTLSDVTKELRIKIRNFKIEKGASATPWIPKIGESLFADYTPVYDRTEADVNAIKAIIAKIESDGYSSLTLAEKDAWLADSKGCLNVQDLIRISTTCNYLAVRLNALGYSVDADLKEDWKRTDYMTQALNEAIINKLHELYTALNDLFIEEGNLRAVFGGGQQTGLTTLPVSYAVLAEPSWASLDLVDVDVDTLDYSTIFDWNAIERFLYDALDFLERIGG